MPPSAVPMRASSRQAIQGPGLLPVVRHPQHVLPDLGHQLTYLQSWLLDLSKHGCGEWTLGLVEVQRLLMTAEQG